VKEQLAFRCTQIEGLLDSFEDDIELLQLVDDLQRSFQAARQAIYFMDVQHLELAAPGSFTHGIDPWTVFLEVSRLGRIGETLDDLYTISLSLFLDLAQLGIQAERIALHLR
jgi:hypothetical protein